MRTFLVCAVAAVLLLLGYCGWPTLYRYHHVWGGSIVRENRFTGHMDRLAGNGWVPISPPERTR